MVKWTAALQSGTPSERKFASGGAGLETSGPLERTWGPRGN